jgi:hypothetical protein
MSVWWVSAAIAPFSSSSLIVGLWSVVSVGTRSGSRSLFIKSLAWLKLCGEVWLVILGIEEKRKNTINNSISCCYYYYLDLDKTEGLAFYLVYHLHLVVVAC